MLSQHQSSLGVGGESRIGANRQHLLVFPRDPQQVLLAGICSGLQHQLGVPSPPAPTFLKQHKTTACEHGVSHSAHSTRPRHTQKEVDRRSMTRMSAQPTPHPPSRRIQFTIPSHGSNNTSFTFVAQPRPAMTLHFPPRPSPPRPGKRGRAVTDVDGELSSLHKKKRRLRLFLITSRLSPEYSSPATNIVDRGSSKIAVWAKQKALGRNLLRKAAILNLIRWRTYRAKDMDDGQGRVLITQEKELKQLELAKLTFTYGSHDPQTRPVLQRDPSSPPKAAVRVGDHFELTSDLSSSSRSPTPTPTPQLAVDDAEDEAPTYRSPNDAYSSYTPPMAQIPRRSYIPLPPSPLGLSNYDAFDLEDDIPDPYSHLDDEDDGQSAGQGYGYTEADPHSPSANASASYSPNLSNDGTRNTEMQRTPPPMIYSDFNILDPGEPVIGDYDQVDEGADAIWPTTALVDMPFPSSVSPMSLEQGVLPASSSPNFTALFATSGEDDVFAPVTGSEASGPKCSVRTRRDSTREIEQEKQRQKQLMFAELNP